MLKRLSLASVMALLLVFAMVLSFSPAIAQDEEPTAIVSSFGEDADVQISFWNGLTGSDGVTLNEMLADFSAQNPDIGVTTEIIPKEIYLAKITKVF